MAADAHFTRNWMGNANTFQSIQVWLNVLDRSIVYLSVLRNNLPKYFKLPIDLGYIINGLPNNIYKTVGKTSG